ncbi:MAG: NHL repeat-containing protein [Solirubrobacteraceae bacterium]
MAVSAAPALAKWGFRTSFGGGVQEPDFHEPVGVTVDETGDSHVQAGSIYVGSLFSGLSGFNLADELVSPTSFFGGFAEMSGVAVNPVNHNVYVVNASEHKIETFDPSSGAKVASFEISGTENIFGFWTGVEIASDAHGNVYVPDAPGNKVEVFAETGGAPEGGVAKEIGAGSLAEPEGVAIDSAGNVWVADTGAGKIEEFSPGGTFIKEIASPDVQAVTPDNSGDVFAADGGTEPQVVEYDPTGIVLSEFGKGVLSQALGLPDGIAVDGAHEIVYVADNGKNVVDRFTSWSATTEAPSKVTEGRATLNGHVEVEPGASVSTCKLEYGPTAMYGNSIFCSPSGPYTTDTAVSAALSGLTPGLDYHYRISATGTGGLTQVGEDRTVGPPVIDSESAEAIVRAATPRAHVTVVMEGESTCSVQYVSEAEYEASGYTNAATIPCTKPIGRMPGKYAVETEAIKELRPNTVYHYRFLTTNQAGTLSGPDETFTMFGVTSFAFDATGQAGEPLTQAGAHPTDMTDAFRLNTSTHTTANGVAAPLATDANPKDVITELPAGVVGNPDATPKCEPYDVAHADCSGATQVGIMEIYTSNPSETQMGQLLGETPVPIYNLVPPKGLAAQFGARFNGFVTVHIDSRVRTGGDYGVTAEVINGSAGEGVVVPEVTLWGVPAAESHDSERYCPSAVKINEVAPCSERGPLIPFLSNPTACTGEREAHMTVEPWQEDEPPVVVAASAKMPAITGCGKIDFKPSIVVQPTSTASDSPSGLHVELKVPQNEDPNGLAEADLKDAKVTLPAGVTVNPSSASGLVGCPLLSGKEGHPEQSGIDLENAEAANCPNASKIGKVKIKTPLLEEELEGGVYVAQQNANPFKSLLALYIAAEAPERGVVVKLAGHVQLDESTGQLTTTFNENPQLPFETLKLDFFGGEQAPLATPRTCGSYQPTALLEPFSHQGASGEEGTPDAEPFIAPFSTTSGPNGATCGTPSFTPSFTAGTINNQAGGFGAFAMQLKRNDGEQRFSTVSIHMPDGTAATLAKVPLCGGAQANAGDCPATSKIGHVTASAGVGSEPISLPEAGKPEDPVYLTGPYDGAPFGLSIVVPAEAGPFNLGTVVVRAKIEVDPHTAQVSVVSDPMPTMLQGIPLDVRSIDVTIDRPEFVFNPTSCEPMSVTGSIGSAEGATAAVSSRFQAAGCSGLPFKPTFAVSTHKGHTKRNGAYLHVKVTSSTGQANIKSVFVKLPKILPSRDETLKQACSEKQFATNPAGCPAGSQVGDAIAHTPVLPVPLSGPAIFVSHGGAGFPDLDVVLQGDGVTVDLEGNTDIVKGITSSDFKSVPDVPISSFELTLPESSHSALAAEGNLCFQTVRKRVKTTVQGKTVYHTRQVRQKRDMIMPTTITGQNGAVMEQATKIAVEGCAKPTSKASRARSRRRLGSPKGG